MSTAAHVQRLLLDAGRLSGEAQLLQRLDPHADLVRGLADRVRRRDRPIDQRREPADGGDAGERDAKRADTGAQQLCLPTEALQATGGLAAGRFDALQALLAALADRDQLGLDLPTALDRQADGIARELQDRSREGRALAGMAFGRVVDNAGRDGTRRLRIRARTRALA
jgi:hypothetical protein